MQQYFMQRIPVGTSVEQARQVLESEKSNVTTRIDVPFKEEGKNTNYLIDQRIDGFIFVRVWHVFVLFKDSVVVRGIVEMREVEP